MARTLTYYKAVRSDGVTATRGSTREFSHAIVHRAGSDSSGSNWFGRRDLAQRAAKPGDEICEAIEITGAELRQIKEAANPSNIVVTYTAVDGARDRRKFRSQSGARNFGYEMLGRSPTLGTNYAVSDDGIGKITVEGMTLAQLFPQA